MKWLKIFYQNNAIGIILLLGVAASILLQQERIIEVIGLLAGIVLIIK
ncbi:Uncharacterised protein [uncultured archaeon]|nr:Uncharacterised protein [uncultured archaeon]